MKKKIIIISIIVIVVVGVIVFVGNRKDNDKVKETNTTDKIDSEVDTDDGDLKIDWQEYDSNDIKLSNSIEITKEGVYNITGSIDNGLILINTDGNVKLNLDSVSINHKNGPCIYVKSANNVVINLLGDNILIDGSNYSKEYSDIDGVLFSHDDLTIEGEGTLEINANYMDGIVSKDDLKFNNGTYIINSNDDGIRGKDSVYIVNGTYNIVSKGDGIKSTEDTDTEKGFIKINNGTFDIESTLDGIQAESKLIIENGEFTIKTGGGSSNSSTNDNWGKWKDFDNASTDTESAKGLKSVDNLVINNGKFNFDTSDDSIHSNNYVGIKNGTYNISSGDDGIHADKELIIDNGVIRITKSYEGLESAKMTINGGDIDLLSSDDGINIAGGNDSSAMNRPGANNYNNKDNILIINDGIIHVDSNGDGIDVNGSGYIYGGNITVEGPTNNGNGALDYDSVFSINGGTFIASGSSGMAQGVSNESTQNTLMINFNSAYSNDDKITIVDSNNNEILSYSSDKSYSSIVYSSNKLVSDKTYTIKINGNEYDTFKTSDTITIVGNSNGMHGGMPGGAMRPEEMPGGGKRPEGMPGNRPSRR